MHCLSLLYFAEHRETEKVQGFEQYYLLGRSERWKVVSGFLSGIFFEKVTKSSSFWVKLEENK